MLHAMIPSSSRSPVVPSPPITILQSLFQDTGRTDVSRPHRGSIPVGEDRGVPCPASPSVRAVPSRSRR